MFANTAVVIICPDAPGLATQTAIVVGTRLGTQRGVLFKKATAPGPRPGSTPSCWTRPGTLTRGEPGVTTVVSLVAHPPRLGLIAALEEQSEHPLAAAVVRHVKERHNIQTAPIQTASAVEFTNIAGHSAGVTVSGHHAAIGNRHLMERLEIPMCDNVDLALDETRKEGQTAATAAVDGQVEAVIGLADAPRDTARGAVAACTGRGSRS